MLPTEETPEKATLRDALKHRTQSELAELLDVSSRTIRRWLVSETPPKSVYMSLLGLEAAARTSRDHDAAFTFVDLFAGIGGLRRGFESQNGRCVFTSEWDTSACRTYRENFESTEKIEGDITKVDPSSIPDHDILLAGFPCQPFSLAGVSKKKSLGRAHGFRDKAQGTLFFNVLKILGAKRPRAFLLENVKNLRSHDGGRTFEIITGSLRELGYQVVTDLIDARPWVPQRRERIFLAGFREEVEFSFSSVDRPRMGPTLGDILHSADEEPDGVYTLRQGRRTVVNSKYTLSDHLWQYLQNYAAKHRAKGNGFGCSVFGESHVARTLSARYHKDGSEILISQGRRNPRRLTPRECARLMGFDRPDRPPMKIPVSDTQAYRQFGNSVVVPAVEAIAKVMVPRVLNPGRFSPLQASLELGQRA